MFTFLVFALAALGCTDIIVNEYVFAWFRNFIDKYFPYSLIRQLIHCEICMGFWVGVVIAILFPALGIHWLLAGCISSALNKIVWSYLILK